MRKLEFLNFTNRSTLGVATYGIKDDPKIRYIDFYRCVPVREATSPQMELLAHAVPYQGWFDSFNIRAIADEVVVEVFCTSEEKDTHSTSNYQYSYTYEKNGGFLRGFSTFVTLHDP